MGGADAVPGVSGGTVALIVGIYGRLVTAVSRFDRRFLHLLRHGNWRDAARYVDLRFLISLGSGIILGVVTLGELMNHLLTSEVTREQTLAVFFGMILASCILVGRMIKEARPSNPVGLMIVGLVGCLIAYVLTGSFHFGFGTSLPYVFVCGVIAICAMILPGISGAYLLWIMGLYLHLTGILKSVRQLTVTVDDIMTVAVFGAGCVVGLLSFSKLLRWMLTHVKAPTLALLCGFMVGALRRVWPFQERIGNLDDAEHPMTQNVLPEVFDTYVVICLVLATAGFLSVLALSAWGRMISTSTDGVAVSKSS